jgi:hypothetical protein
MRFTFPLRRKKYIYEELVNFIKIHWMNLWNMRYSTNIAQGCYSTGLVETCVCFAAWTNRWHIKKRIRTCSSIQFTRWSGHSWPYSQHCFAIVPVTYYFKTKSMVPSLRYFDLKRILLLQIKKTSELLTHHERSCYISFQNSIRGRYTASKEFWLKKKKIWSCRET